MASRGGVGGHQRGKIACFACNRVWVVGGLRLPRFARNDSVACCGLAVGGFEYWMPDRVGHDIGAGLVLSGFVGVRHRFPS